MFKYAPKSLKQKQWRKGAVHTNTYTVFINLLLLRRKNSDAELQGGSMFLTYQVADIPTFMLSGRSKTNIEPFPPKLILKKRCKLNRQ
jgi:hypothetical protein